MYNKEIASFYKMTQVSFIFGKVLLNLKLCHFLFKNSNELHNFVRRYKSVYL